MRDIDAAEKGHNPMFVDRVVGFSAGMLVQWKLILIFALKDKGLILVAFT